MKVVSYPKPPAESRPHAGGGPGAQSRSFAELIGAPSRSETKAQAPEPAPNRGRKEPMVRPGDINPALTAAERRPVVAADGRMGVESLSRGFQFDELGMFGQFATIRSPRTVVDEPAAIAGTASPGVGGQANPPDLAPPATPDLMCGTGRAEPTPGGWARPQQARAAVVLATEPPAAVLPPFTRFADAFATMMDAEPGAETETAPAHLSSDLEPPTEGDEPLRIVLHDDGDGISLAVAAPLTHADQTRVWRNIKDYADRLGLELRTFHLNGRTGDGPDPGRRDRNGA